jgi:acetolactate decarboxylase
VRLGTSENEIIESLLRASLRSRSKRLYQISTSAALVQGVLAGEISSALMMEAGDLGLGTFEDFDGEMMIIDGEIFRMGASGVTRVGPSEIKIPFAQVCWFTSQQSCSFRKIANLLELLATCTQCRRSENLFYAFRIDAYFNSIHVRTVRETPQGSSLERAGDSEATFSWSDVSGSLVGFWSPAYSASLSVPGYHFHFISDDRTKGGHVLDCSFEKSAAHVQVLTDYEVVLPPAGAFLKADLSIDTRSVLRKVE